jgi:hypothetical protein
MQVVKPQGKREPMNADVDGRMMIILIKYGV